MQTAAVLVTTLGIITSATLAVPSPLLAASVDPTFQPETTSTSPVWEIEATPSPSPIWQTETTGTTPQASANPPIADQQPQWITIPTAPNDAIAQQQPPSFGNAPLETVEPTTTAVTSPSPEDIQALEEQLKSYQEAPKALINPYRASPGITLSNPSGFGSDRGRVSVGLGLQRTRINTNDGAASIGIGLGNAQTGIGVQLSYTSYSISPEKLIKTVSRKILASDRPFGSGGFNLKIHKQFPDGLSVAVGADSIVNIGPPTLGAFGEVQNELQGTYYAAATKLFRLKPDATESFSRLAVTVGAGLGPRFQPIQGMQEDKKIVTPFASAALKLSPAASFITEWSGQDFGIALSWVPFRNLPIVLTPAIRDIFGPDARKPRFVLGFGLSL
jgi:hypothetical protein